MRTYTLHVPREERPGDPAALERAELVRDGFSWGAFFFTALWFFVHRLWLAGLGVLAALLALGAAYRFLGLGAGTVLLAHILFAVLIGLEANSLRRWTCARRGRPAVAVVAAADEQEAALKTFAQWLAAPDVPRGSARREPATAGGYPLHESVIGMFPDPERSR